MPDNVDVRGPRNVALRPINRGMIRDLPSNGIPNGAFLRLQNYRVHEYGIRRRGGFRPFNSNATECQRDRIKDKVYDMVYFYSSSFSQPQMLTLTSKHLYRLNGTNTSTMVLPDTTDNFTVDTNTEVAPTSTEVTLTFPVTTETLVYEVGTEVYYKLPDETRYVLLGVVNGNGSVDTGVGTLTVLVEDEIAEAGIAENGLLDAELQVIPTFLSEDKFGPSYAVAPSPNAGLEGYMVIADQAQNTIWKYDGTTLTKFVADDTDWLTSAKTVAYFEDRLWFGNTVEVDGGHRQRIRWSDAFNYTSVPASNYVDLPYSSGQLLAIVPLGSLLAVYFEDAIYLGRPTQIRGLPYIFDRLETGEMGLVSARAVKAWQDGHYFVGQDNIYRLSGPTALQPIGAPILSESLDYTKELGLLHDVQVEHDPYAETMCFLFPDIEFSGSPIEGSATRLWRFNYKAQGWAYDEVHFKDNNKTQPSFVFSGLAPTRFYVSGRSWEDWIGDDPEEGEYSDLGGGWNTEQFSRQWLPEFRPNDSFPYLFNVTFGGSFEFINDGELENVQADVTSGESFYSYNTWENLKQEILRDKKLYLPIYYLDTANPRLSITEEFTSGDSDFFGDSEVVQLDGEFNLIEKEYPIWSVLESADYDFGQPNIEKTVTQMSVKYFTNRVSRLTDLLEDEISNLVFRLQISDSMGYRWKRPVRLRFRNNYNEGKADFRSTGSNFRFKLINGDIVAPYKLSEIVMRVIGRGLQIDT